MAVIVQKFGGTSVGSLERIQHVAGIILQAREQGHQLAVVVSAMGGETDRLLSLAKLIHEEPDPREYSALLSTGEQVSMTLLCMVLKSRGYRARSFTGRQAGIKTESRYKDARIVDIDSSALQAYMAEGGIPVIAGFQGYCENGDITTLGRGGSDTTAVALSASMKAKECHIYTDVDGVYTADPRVVPEARRLSQITFDEMLELASLGAKVLQIRSVEFASKYNVPIRVLSSFGEGEGTLISDKEPSMEEPVISGVAYNRSEAKLTIIGVPDKPGIAHAILGPISEQGIEIDMIVQNVAEDDTTDFTFTIHRDDYRQASELLNQLLPSLGARRVIGDSKIAKLSLVGVGMRSHAGVASRMFKALAAEGINIQMIATSEIKVSVVVDEKYVELGTRALHAAFELDKEVIEE